MLKEMQHGNFGSGSSQIAYLFEVTKRSPALQMGWIDRERHTNPRDDDNMTSGAQGAPLFCEVPPQLVNS